MQLHGKVAVVTGGARGIGKAIAHAFAGRGATLALLDLNQRYQGVVIETIAEIVGPERDARALGGALWLAVDANFFLSVFDKSDRGFEQRSAAARALADLIIDEAQLSRTPRGEA